MECTEAASHAVDPFADKGVAVNERRLGDFGGCVPAPAPTPEPAPRATGLSVSSSTRVRATSAATGVKFRRTLPARTSILGVAADCRRNDGVTHMSPSHEGVQ